jgi:hypothetical protein
MPLFANPRFAAASRGFLFRFSSGLKRQKQKVDKK